MRKLAALPLSLAICFAVTAQSHAAVIEFTDFSDLSDFTLGGSAAGAVSALDGDVLRLTPNGVNEVGGAFLTNPVSLDSDASFSTSFRFRMSGMVNGQGADGIVVVVQTTAANVGLDGGGIGYRNIDNSIGIEFDTHFNDGVDEDIGFEEDSHVGINVDGDMESVAVAGVSGPKLDDDIDFLPPFDTANLWSAWIDYNGVNDDLEVRLSTGTVRPTTALLSVNLPTEVGQDLAGILGQTDAFIGFTSATGTDFADHDIVDWRFETQFNPNPDPEGEIPEPTSLITLAGLGLCFGGFGYYRRRKQA